MKHPEKNRARSAVQAAIKSGLLVRPDACQRCGQIGKPDAHHTDYAHQLQVQWLCQRCHKQAHFPHGAQRRKSATFSLPAAEYDSIESLAQRRGLSLIGLVRAGIEALKAQKK